MATLIAIVSPLAEGKIVADRQARKRGFDTEGPMRQVRYSVAMSLDGFIAGPAGEFDWIPMDPDVDFGTIFARYDTVLLGRHTYEVALRQGGGLMAGLKPYVFSASLRSADHPGVTVVSTDAGSVVAELRRGEGKDIWLMGGGQLFRSLLTAGLVDGVDVSVVPVLLGGGIPAFPGTGRQTVLSFTGSRTYSRTGIVSLQYDRGVLSSR
jgi:dihydrofolate reductase